MAIDPNNLQGTAHVTFDDEFNSLSLWGPSNPSGTWATTFWYLDPSSSNGNTLDGNGEQEWYINSNYGPTSSVTPWTDSNGIMTITAAPASSATSSLINGYSYTSGEINTYHSFSQTYGYFEMRAQLPAGQGFWPAFWLMPENGAWPPELDVMEVLGNATSTLYNTVHTMETGSHLAIGDGGTTVADMSTGYHTYGVDWEPDYITWYFDGQKVYQTATPSDLNTPMYMIANLAAGGYWPGSVTPGSVGQMNIDYIRAYASGAAADGGSTPTAPTTPTTPIAPTTPAAPTTPDSTGGQTYTSDNNGDHWVAMSGDNLFNLGRGGDVVTGGSGNNTFKFTEAPWNVGHITDFHTGDVLDISGLFQTYGYTGSNPLADGHLKFVDDGAGGTQVWVNLDGLPVGAGGNWLVTDLDHVAPSSLSIANGLITEGSAGGNTSTSGSTASDGHTFTTDNNGDTVVGTSGNDTFNLGRGGDWVTGNGGNDTFKFAEVPWNPAHLTDFHAGDVLDLSQMFQHYGYAGSDPMADGHLKFVDDGAGGTQVWANLDGLPIGAGGNWHVADLANVAPSSLSEAGGVITEGSASSGTSTSDATSSSTVGQTFTTGNTASDVVGTSGNDTFNLGRDGDWVTGNGGNDTFKFAEVPWNPAHITDFHSGDVMDLSQMFQTYGYTGSDPAADGHLKFVDDGSGGTQVWANLDGLPSGSGGNWYVADLEHFSSSSLHVNGAFITG